MIAVDLVRIEYPGAVVARIAEAVLIHIFVGCAMNFVTKIYWIAMTWIHETVVVQVVVACVADIVVGVVAGIFLTGIAYQIAIIDIVRHAVIIVIGVASVSDAVFIFVRLFTIDAWIIGHGTIVFHVGDAIVVIVRIAHIANAIVLIVGLVRMSHVRAQVASIAIAVAVKIVSLAIGPHEAIINDIMGAVMIDIILQVKVGPDLVCDDDRPATAATAANAAGRRCTASEFPAFIENVVGNYCHWQLRQNDHNADQKCNCCKYIPWFHLAPHHLVLSYGFAVLQLAIGAPCTGHTVHPVLFG